MQESGGVHDAAMETRPVRRVLPRRGERTLLPWLLLGPDDAALRRRRHEPLVDRCAYCICPPREGGPIRREGRALFGTGSYRGWRVERDSWIFLRSASRRCMSLRSRGLPGNLPPVHQVPDGGTERNILAVLRRTIEELG